MIMATSTAHLSIARSTLMSLCFLPFAACCCAGTIRDDRDPQLYLDLAQNPKYASAGLLHITRGTDTATTGSGVLIGGQWVLTAAHLLNATTDMTFTVGGQDYAAAGWVAYPKFTGDLRRGYDLALVRLTTPVTNVAPAGLSRSHREQNQVGTFVGFGRTGNGLTGGQPFDQVDFLGRAGTNVIDGTVDYRVGFGHYRPKLSGRVFVSDFDNPHDAADNTTGLPDPTDLEFLISQGDSGGPVFLDDPKTGAALVAGIHSFGEFVDAHDDSDYGDVSGETRVSVFRSWITKTTRRGDLGKTIRDFVNAGGATAMELRSSAIPEPAGLVAAIALGVLCPWRRRSRR
jgi:hypothetical protein